MARNLAWLVIVVMWLAGCASTPPPAPAVPAPMASTAGCPGGAPLQNFVLCERCARSDAPVSFWVITGRACSLQELLAANGYGPQGARANLCQVAPVEAPTECGRGASPGNAGSTGSGAAQSQPVLPATPSSARPSPSPTVTPRGTSAMPTRAQR